MIASDWFSAWPSSTSVGTSRCGLIAAYASAFCSSVSSQTTSGWYARPLWFSAQRTRNAAELRK